MSAKIASSPSDIPSTSRTSHEIVPLEDTNHPSSSISDNSTQIPATNHVNNEENSKPVVLDQPKAKKESSKVSSLCLPFKSKQEKLDPKSIPNQPTSAAAADNNNNNGEPRSTERNLNEETHDSNGGGHSVTKQLSRMVGADLNFIQNASERIKTHEKPIEAVSERWKKLNEEDGSEDDFRDLKKIVKKLKQKISSQHKDEHDDSTVPSHLWAGGATSGTNADNLFDKMPNLTKNAAFQLTLEFKEFEASYRKLSKDLKMCLLSFAIFPENAEIKKRVMIYWWIGEGFVPPLLETNNGEGFVPPLLETNNGGETNNVATKNTSIWKAEQFANECFKMLVAEGFVAPTRKKHGDGVDICKMHPFVRSMVIKLAKRANFFNFDDEGNIKDDDSSSLRACLTGKGLAKIQCLENLHALFNLNEDILEFSPELFAKMKNINVLYLGRWQTSAMQHIEVEDTKTMKIKNANVLDGLENVKNLRFLSLQGISRIMKLPESISKLRNLTILDIRACHNLEEIPEGIGLLKNLTHLDMSECYLLDQMPKGLALLSKLEVLSGFVVGDSDGKTSCNLEDLRKLTNLRKLSIHTGITGFPSDDELRALNQYRVLEKLTITWGRAVQAKNHDTKDNKKEGSNEAEQGTEASKKSVQRSLTRASTSKQSPGTPNRGSGEDGKNKDISGKQLPKTLNKGNQEDGKNKYFNKPTKADKKSKLQKVLSRTKTLKGAAEGATEPVLPLQLTKLDLQCFPEMTRPKWLRACYLKSLEKLYVRGGKFADLGQFQDFDGEEDVEGGIEKVRWEVKELRLKYLTELEMDWRELQDLFPKLSYLEKVQCPRLTLFPCDGSGVWMKKKTR